MQHLEISCAVRRIYTSLGAKGLTGVNKFLFVFFVYVFLFRVEFYVRSLNIILGTCEFCANRLEEVHTSLTPVSEITLYVYYETLG